MIILSIETSCDETAISIVEAVGDFPNAKYEILGNALFSQIDIHREFGGVFPTVAKREHIATILPMLEKALSLAGFKAEYTPELNPEETTRIETILNREFGLSDQLLHFHKKFGRPTIDVIAVTSGPGLEPALWVGINFAKALAYLWNIPVIPVDHMEGHILASVFNNHSLSQLQFPTLALLVSGGHTEMILKNILDAAKFVVVGIYFWSGLQKINTAFFTEVFPWFTEPIWSHFGQFGFGVMFFIGLLIPFIESAFAIGLLTKRFRKVAILGSTLMLLLVTISLMIGHGWNTVVWPWNFAIFSMVNVLFFGSKDTFFDLFSRTKNNILGLIAITLFIVMPAGNIFDKADNYLSWSLYSGHVPTAIINISPETLKIIAPKAEYTPNTDTSVSVHLIQWSISTVNTPPYPEIWVFENVFSKLCNEYDEDPFLSLTIKKRSFFMSHNYELLQYNCNNI